MIINGSIYLQGGEIMLEVALKLLEEITACGFKAYIVGGFVRDYILGINSNDIDITTSATPKDIKEIFEDSCLPSEDYGSVTVIKKGIRFEITTFRKEIGYIDNRRPAEIKYIDDLYEDLLRRDFTINALAYHPNQGIVDYLGGINDLNNRIIKFIKDPNISIVLDPIRLIRALRFSLTLGFDIDENDYRVMIKECKRVSELGKIRFDELERICNIDGVKTHLLKHYNIYLAAYPELKNILLKALNSDFDIRNLKYLLFDKQELNCLSKEDIKIQEGINEVINSRTDLYNTKLLYIKYNDKLDIIFDVLELMDKDVSLLKYNLELIRNNNFCLKIKDLSISYKDLEELGVPQNKYSIYLNELLDIVLKDDKLNNRKILLDILKNKV